MAMAAVKLRATRFRLSDADALLPPPLPLINLPDEARLARTGVPGLRPTHLPVRRHLIESRCSTTSSSPLSTTMRDPEPILRESRMLIETEAEEDEAREIVARMHVYEYGQPEVFQNSGASDDTLVFDALFESGNLQRAERIYRHESARTAATTRQEYELTIHPDIKNSAYRQWFYFEVRNGKPGVTYKFALTNLAKSGALFGNGLQPVVYSDIDAKTRGVGWVHRGTHVRYDVSLSPDSAPGTTCLSFQYEFEHENDCVYFACLQPYTYTDLNEYLESLERNPERAGVCRRTELCQTIAQNPCDLLSITSFGKDGIPPDEKRGEPNSSWMMKGMIDYLTGPSTGAQVLRKHFLFKIVPMLNPDGVVNGNTRVNLAGWDLNRKWSYPVEKLFPTVYHLKRLIATLQARDRVAIYCDLHGHSLNRNIFTYGCYNKKATKRSTAYLGTISSSLSNANLSSSAGSGSSSSTSIAATSLRASVKNDPRVFPMIVAKHAPFFSFASCDFKVHKSKLNTARVVVNHELGVINSYTLEASFCGPDFGPRKDTQFATWDLEEMGQAWCQSLLIYFDLVADVKALDAELVLRASAQTQEAVSSALAASPTGHDSPLIGTPSSSSTLEITSSLLSDCEAAISELFASAAEVEYDDDAADMVSMDSDLSGAEDEPIPPSGAELFVREHSDRVGGYSSAPEGVGDGEQASPERPGRGSRRKSRGASRKTSKKGSKHRSKSAKTKKDKTRAPDVSVALVDDETGNSTSVNEHQTVDAGAGVASSKKKSTSKQQRRKSKSGKERSKSFRRLKKASVSDESEDGEVLVDASPPSARATNAHADAVVLPSMPGSAGRRHSKTGTLSISLSINSSNPEQQQAAETDSAILYDRAFVCPTPPTHKGRSRLVRTASPPPIELPLLRTGESASSGFKERVLEARVPPGARYLGGRSDSDDDDDDGDAALSDSDASVQSGPESYLSEF